MKTFIVGFKLPGKEYYEILVAAESREQLKAVLAALPSAAIVRTEVFAAKVFSLEEITENFNSKGLLALPQPFILPGYKTSLN